MRRRKPRTPEDEKKSPFSGSGAGIGVGAEVDADDVEAEAAAEATPSASAGAGGVLGWAVCVGLDLGFLPFAEEEAEGVDDDGATDEGTGIGRLGVGDVIMCV